ncbi:hypothetical protein DFH09DRAFT_1272641 [Mycena vulgaris]|nr:hypothetical protein DFH09DRAFT_1272641 [Mycena vulgaris]
MGELELPKGEASRRDRERLRHKLGTVGGISAMALSPVRRGRKKQLTRSCHLCRMWCNDSQANSKDIQRGMRIVWPAQRSHSRRMSSLSSEQRIEKAAQPMADSCRGYQYEWDSHQVKYCRANIPKFQKQADKIHAVLLQADPLALLFGHLSLPLTVGSIHCTLLGINLKITEIASKWSIRGSGRDRSREGFDASLQPLQERRKMFSDLSVVKHDAEDGRGWASESQTEQRKFPGSGRDGSDEERLKNW